MSDDTHEDGRELGYGNVDSRPKVDGETGVGSPPKGSESGGGPRVSRYEQGASGTAGKEDELGGQSEQGYSGPDNDNATSTRDATRDRAS